MRVEITQGTSDTRELDVSIDVERTTMEAAHLCGSPTSGDTSLRTRLVLTDGAHGPVGVSTEQQWQCKKKQLKTP